jgi:hypothetical protein
MARKNQPNYLVSCYFDLLTQLSPIFVRVLDENDEEIPLGPDEIVDVPKFAHGLICVKSGGSLGTRIWPRKQAHMKRLPIRAIDDRGPFSPNKDPSTVTALIGVPAHRGISLHGASERRQQSEAGNTGPVF